MSNKELFQEKLNAVVANTQETKQKVGVVIQMLKDAKETGSGMSDAEVASALEKLTELETGVQGIEDAADAAIAVPEVPPSE